MARKAIMQASDSQNQAVQVNPRNERIYSLTPLGRAACRWIEQQEQLSDEFSYFCPGCLRPISECSCPVDER